MSETKTVYVVTTIRNEFVGVFGTPRKALQAKDQHSHVFAETAVVMKEEIDFE